MSASWHQLTSPQRWDQRMITLVIEIVELRHLGGRVCAPLTTPPTMSSDPECEEPYRLFLALGSTVD